MCFFSACLSKYWVADIFVFFYDNATYTNWTELNWWWWCHVHWRHLPRTFWGAPASSALLHARLSSCLLACIWAALWRSILPSVSEGGLPGPPNQCESQPIGLQSWYIIMKDSYRTHVYLYLCVALHVQNEEGVETATRTHLYPPPLLVYTLKYSPPSPVQGRYHRARHQSSDCDSSCLPWISSPSDLWAGACGTHPGGSKAAAEVLQPKSSECDRHNCSRCK